MGSSRGQDRSLDTGTFLPQWLKGRGDARYDFDQSSFSPPSHDDSFLCIRYSSKSATERTSDSAGSVGGQDGYRPISHLLSENKISNSTIGHTNVPSSSSFSSSSSSGSSDIKNIDFSKHPLPCQPFVPAAEGKDSKSSSVGFSSRLKVAKSQGTDDGFHSEPALCGKSIVHVANRMMSGKLVKIDSSNESRDSYKNSGSMEQQQQQNDEQFLKKGSKSLPVTPIASPISTPDTSPKSRRRVNANRYFTAPFVPDREKYQTGWLLSSILGQSRELAMGTSHKIPEADEDDDEPIDMLPAKFLNRKKSISSQNLSYIGKNDEQDKNNEETKKETAVYKNVLRAKPSELREMNFWSPTSM